MVEIVRSSELAGYILYKADRTTARAIGERLDLMPQSATPHRTLHEHYVLDVGAATVAELSAWLLAFNNRPPAPIVEAHIG